MDKNREKIISESTPVRHAIRLPNFNYTQQGAYFITICTYERKPILGQISDGNLGLNRNGEIVNSCWSGIPKHFSNIELAGYIIMPNHIHGIIVMNEPVAARHAVPEEDKVSFKSEDGFSESFGKPIGGSLATVIRSFKSGNETGKFNPPGQTNPFLAKGIL